MTESCGSCRYFKKALTRDFDGEWGRCVRYPPASIGGSTITAPQSWCGEWRGTPMVERHAQNEELKKLLGAEIPEHLKYSGLEGEEEK